MTSDTTPSKRLYRTEPSASLINDAVDELHKCIKVYMAEDNRDGRRSREFEYPPNYGVPTKIDRQYPELEKLICEFPRQVLTRLYTDHGPLLNDMSVSYKRSVMSLVRKRLEALPTPTSASFKRYNIQDPIYEGGLEIPYLCMLLVNTPQFQRLRNIKQLGAVQFVYPSATHTRFAHCLGVCYIAGVYLNTLRRNQPEAGIEDKMILLVQIAGLCHDLGHGPFSHSWEGVLSRMGVDSSHESMSVLMLQRILETHPKIRQEFYDFGIYDEDIHFVFQLILEKKTKAPKDFVWVTTPPSMAFYYQIISDPNHGFDVDKFDYIVRDSFYTDVKVSIDVMRLIKSARVIAINGQRMIAFNEKEDTSLTAILASRKTLYANVYFHKVSFAVDVMLVDAMVSANSHFFKLRTGINGVDNAQLKDLELKDAHRFLEVYETLTDNIYYEILYSNNPELKEARNLIQRIESRDLFKQVALSKILDNDPDVNYKNDLISLIRSHELFNSDMDIYINGIIVKEVNIGYKDVRSLAEITYYSKVDKTNTYNKILKSLTHQGKIIERELRVIIKDYNEAFVTVVQESLNSYCEEDGQSALSPPTPRTPNRRFFG